MQNIDWEEQWRLHGANYKDGFVHLNLPNHTLKLRPGPGFGDLSHPTTLLVIQLMPGLIQNQTVVDIGCGSGILTLASKLLGASRAIGVDIDPEAVSHSLENAKINNIEADFFTPENFSIPMIPCIVLMNMITSEQDIAWHYYEKLWDTAQDLVVSGILAEQKAAYLKVMQNRGWKCVNEAKKKGWMGFHLRKM